MVGALEYMSSGAQLSLLLWTNLSFVVYLLQGYTVWVVTLYGWE